MIYFYSGTPGSGKSLHAARDIMNKIRLRKQNVIIVNTMVDYEYIRTNHIKRKINKLLSFFRIRFQLNDRIKDHGKLFQLNRDKLTTDFLYLYALKHHEPGKEGQTLLVIDEAQDIFSPSAVKLKCQQDTRYRQDWLEFFSQHRHMGYNIIIISQFDMLIDPQIRYLFEYDVKHRKANNFKIGFILSIFKIQLFLASSYWYGLRLHNYSEYFTYRKKYKRIYNSYKKYEELKDIIKDRMEQKRKYAFMDKSRKKHA